MFSKEIQLVFAEPLLEQAQPAPGPVPVPAPEEDDPATEPTRGTVVPPAQVPRPENLVDLVLQGFIDGPLEF